MSHDSKKCIWCQGRTTRNQQQLQVTGRDEVVIYQCDACLALHTPEETQAHGLKLFERAWRGDPNVTLTPLTVHDVILQPEGHCIMCQTGKAPHKREFTGRDGVTAHYRICDQCARTTPSDLVMEMCAARLTTQAMRARMSAQRPASVFPAGTQLDEIIDLVEKKSLLTETKAPWIKAIEMQLAAKKIMDGFAKRSEKLGLTEGKVAIDGEADETIFDVSEPGENSLKVNFQYDASALKFAQPYSFSGDALTAIYAASQSIPTDVALTHEHIPGTGAGWWWFQPGLPIKSRDNSATAEGLLYSYSFSVNQLSDLVSDLSRAKPDKDGYLSVEVDADKRPVYLSFSIYTMTELPSGRVEPLVSTVWKWFLGESINQTLARVSHEHDRLYGENGIWKKYGDNKALTLRAIRQMSQFFLAACVWVQQKIVETAPAHVERHLGKRLAREHKLPERPRQVTVIALRKKERAKLSSAEADMTDADPKHIDWSCRWLVDVGWRKQRFGPGRSETKLVYVMPFMKGPEDKPFRPPRKKVMAVIR